MKSTTRNILAILTLLCSVVTLVLVALAFARRHQEELECGEFDDLMDDDDYITRHLDEQQTDFASEEDAPAAEEAEQEPSLEETLAQEEE